jgi:hypothetical protein
MKGDTMFKVRFGIFIAVFLFVSGVMFAQQDTTDFQTRDRDYNTGTMDQDATTTQPWTEDLRTRLNLREDQVTDINDIMLRYQRESTNIQGTPETMDNSRTELQRRYSTEIEGVLDENQRMQWQNYSDTWWNNVNTHNIDGTHKDQDFREQDQNVDPEQDQYDTDTYDTETDTYDTDTQTDTETDTDTDVR